MGSRSTKELVSANVLPQGAAKHRSKRQKGCPPRENQTVQAVDKCSCNVLFYAARGNLAPGGRKDRKSRLDEGKNVRWPVSRVLFRRSGDDHSSRRSVTGSLKQPTRVAVRIPDLSGKPDVPPLFGFAPGGVCRAIPVAGNAVRSYRTVSPLPAPLARGRRSDFCGTFPGVAPAGRYPAPCVRGARTFLPRACTRRRPSGHLTRPMWTPSAAASRLR